MSRGLDSLVVALANRFLLDAVPPQRPGELGSLANDIQAAIDLWFDVRDREIAADEVEAHDGAS